MLSFIKMNKNSSSSFSSSGGSLTSSSSSGGPLCIPVFSLRVVYDNKSILVNDISSVLTKKDVDRLHDHYQISQEIFRVYAPTSRVLVDDRIPAKDTIIVYKEKLEVNLQFSINLFFVEVFRFHKLAAGQLHPNT